VVVVVGPRRVEKLDELVVVHQDLGATERGEGGFEYENSPALARAIEKNLLALLLN
jgi:hypothetical protein